MRCLPSAIPELIEIDVTELDVHDSVKLSDIELAEGVAARMEPTRTICVVTVPKAVESAEEEEDVEAGLDLVVEEGPEGEE